MAAVAVMGQGSADETWRELLEQWAEQNDSEMVPDDYLEQLMMLAEEPLNINDTMSDGLMMLPFLTDLQREIIRAYIAQNGAFASLGELHLLNGFDSTTIRLLTPFVEARPVEYRKPLSLGDVVRYGHSNLRMGVKSVFPRSRGYEEEIYAGSPYRMYFRYLFKYHDKVSFQLSGDKDPGEAFRFVSPGAGFASGQRGFDFYGYHLMLNDVGFVKRAIVGRYQLRFGQGLTMWSGSAPWMAGNMPLRRYGQGIGTASAFCEYGYLNGAAASFALPGKVELTAFYSNANRDATLANDTADGAEEVYQSLYESGYHRTRGEMAKKGVLNEQVFGGRVQYATTGLVVGTTVAATHYANPITPHDYVYNHFAFRGKDLVDYGVDATYRYKRMMMFAEGSMSLADSVDKGEFLPVAVVAGMQMQFDASTLLSAAYRYGSPNYCNQHSNVVGHSSTVQNGEDFIVYFRSCPFRFVEVEAVADYFRNPWMRYRMYSPTSGVDYRLRVGASVARGTQLSVQFRNNHSQRNGDGQLYATGDIERRQLQMSLDYNPSASWQLLSRVVCSWFDGEEEQPGTGFLMFQEATWRTSIKESQMSLTARLALFDITAYDARIYTYESDMMYEYSVPMLTGRGIRLYMLTRCELTPRISGAIKYAVTCYPEREQVGSGYDQTEGGVRHEVKIQVRLKF